LFLFIRTFFSLFFFFFVFIYSENIIDRTLVNNPPSLSPSLYRPSTSPHYQPSIISEYGDNNRRNEAEACVNMVTTHIWEWEKRREARNDQKELRLESMADKSIKEL
jgi:hypothetical protein